MTFDPAPILRFLDASNPGASTRALATHLGVCTATVRRWRAGETMRESTADRIAVHLGMHPSNLWPDWDRTETP